jgi:hypothetical protein
MKERKKKSCTLPKQDKEAEKKSRGVGVRGGLFGVFVSSLHEDWPGIGVVETFGSILERFPKPVLKNGQR